MTDALRHTLLSLVGERRRDGYCEQRVTGCASDSHEFGGHLQESPFPSTPNLPLCCEPCARRAFPRTEGSCHPGELATCQPSSTSLLMRPCHLFRVRWVCSLLLPAKLVPVLLPELLVEATDPLLEFRAAAMGPSGPATGRCCDGALSSRDFNPICKLFPKIMHEVPHPALAPAPILKPV